MKAAVEAGKISKAELDEHVRRVLRAEFAAGLSIIHSRRAWWMSRAASKPRNDRGEEHGAAEEFEAALLPLDSATVKSIAIIGPHADTGMISGGGSAQVDPPGQAESAGWQAHVWFPTSPMKAVSAKSARQQTSNSTRARIRRAAAALAKKCDVAIVFAYQWTSEGMDSDELVAAGKTGRADCGGRGGESEDDRGAGDGHCRHDAVGGSRWAAVLEAWYAGSKGAMPWPIFCLAM